MGAITAEPIVINGEKHGMSGIAMGAAGHRDIPVRVLISLPAYTKPRSRSLSNVRGSSPGPFTSPSGTNVFVLMASPLMNISGTAPHQDQPRARKMSLVIVNSPVRSTDHGVINASARMGSHSMRPAGAVSDPSPSLPASSEKNSAGQLVQSILFFSHGIFPFPPVD